MADEIRWTFHGYVTPAGGRDVQDWFDGLDQDARDEINDAIGYLRLLPIAQWRRPEFAPLDGGLSEIRVKANQLRRIFRMYGFFWPPKRRFVYTLLLGSDKKVQNPQHDIAEARKRLSRVQNKEASIHEFCFSEDAD
jgi:hypothetical protein